MNHVVKNGSLSIWGWVLKFGLLFIGWILIKSSYLWSVLMLLFMYLELMGKCLSLFWDDLEAIRGQLYRNFEILHNLHLVCVQHPMTIFAFSVQCHVQWSFLRLASRVASRDHFHVQHLVSHPVTILRLMTILSPMIDFEFSDHFESSDHLESDDQFWV